MESKINYPHGNLPPSSSPAKMRMTTPRLLPEQRDGLSRLKRHPLPP
ncbi:hypothetical protein PVAG01_06996 [Phlyctema vagabunda]|uniref:Uncharacterized protein n=1 Tax=Phlyctema vagabunda TaxID=108571 RepID=A0ABR4PB59_9HELO